ncbi:hypothetical protein [Verrucosispora sp. WMMD573]|uniref:hypothetical protein n=1 Tax=Verrucosispora sp. WMMD573 TaxID=3015149 RepID=UPI00248BF66D|nr:hypothetical protein [Verrucosispora sp. WMMD573]WBB54319.1 hypothetical protein O7601_27980 [Verrucosispora sp. WMMD573]
MPTSTHASLPEGEAAEAASGAGAPGPAYPVLGSLLVSLLLAVAFLLARPMGTDLSAQVARAGFAGRNGLAPLDFSWYGGVNQFGYSLYTQMLGALVGVRPVGAVAAVVSAVALAWLLVLTGARRPLLGGLLGAIVLVGNLASGRITFAVGLMWALLALCLVAWPRGTRWWRLAAAGAAAVLATAASPVAGLFLGLAGGALLVLDVWRDRRPGTAALVLCLAPLVTVAPMAALFGNGGRQPFSAESLRINLALAVVVLALVPVRALRVGAALTALLLVAAYHLPSPIGSNALRLPMLFALPIVAAYVGLGRRWLAALLVALFWWQSPVMTNDIARRGAAPAYAAFHEPLLNDLERRGPVGRIEVVPLRDHWESAFVAAAVPLARGWERQVDVGRNPLFYDGSLDAGRYGEWLRRNAVSYVAIAPDAALDRYGQDEATLVLAGQPYLREVGRPGQWRLYQVLDPAPLVSPPAQLVTSDDAGVRFTVDAPADVLVRVRWSRWLSLSAGDGCLSATPDEWVTVRARTAGTFEVTSSLRPAGHCPPG